MQERPCQRTENLQQNLFFGLLCRSLPGPLSRLVSVVTSNVPANNACQMIGFADVLDLVDKKKLYRQSF
jgi:hypothetical protein